MNVTETTIPTIPIAQAAEQIGLDIPGIQTLIAEGLIRADDRNEDTEISPAAWSAFLGRFAVHDGVLFRRHGEQRTVIVANGDGNTGGQISHLIRTLCKEVDQAVAIHTCGNAGELRSLVAEQRPAVVFMDANLPNGSSDPVDACRDVRKSDGACYVFVTGADDRRFSDYQAAGAEGSAILPLELPLLRIATYDMLGLRHNASI